MSEHDLFRDEAEALAEAMRIAASADLSSAAYRDALSRLTEHYQRLIRETRRLIVHSDRQERELTKLNGQLKTLAAQLDHKARHDALTGVLNRGAIIERIAEMLTKADVAVIVLDIDHFKRVNDEFGHPAGDAVIVELVQRIKTALGERGDIGRVGGEEFTVALRDTDLAQAAATAESIRAHVADRRFAAVAGRPVTASLGVSWNARGISFDAAYARADQMLYEAKRNGRNQVVWKLSPTD